MLVAVSFWLVNCPLPEALVEELLSELQYACLNSI